jgi:hypothetical protein
MGTTRDAIANVRKALPTESIDKLPPDATDAQMVEAEHAISKTLALNLDALWEAVGILADAIDGSK